MHKIDIIFSSVNVYRIQERIGIIQALKDSVLKNNSVSIRILLPKGVRYAQNEAQKLDNKIDGFEARYFTYNSDVRTKTLIVDRKECLVMEIKEEDKRDGDKEELEEEEERYDKVSEKQEKEKIIIPFNKIIGLSTYSNSRSTVLSYAAMFDTLWKETELHEQVRGSTKRLEIANRELESTNTQLALANEQLKTNNKIQKDFINIAAHELRTPIQPILGCVDLLEEKLEGINDQVKDELSMISRNANRLHTLSEDLLQLDKIESGRFILNLQPVNIILLISSVIEDIRLKYSTIKQKSDVQILFDLETNNITDTNIYNNNNNNDNDNHTSNDKQLSLLTGTTVMCDKTKISQVLFNLLDNAMKYTNEGRIVISAEVSSSLHHSSIATSSSKNNKNNNNGCSCSSDVVVVSVSDTGKGIDKSIEDKLFEKFVSSSKDRTGGIGIGLYLSRKIVESHGGKIWVANKLYGTGATFRFRLPLLLQSQ